jgi:hypothetical protein
MFLGAIESGAIPRLAKIVAGSFTPPLVVDPFATGAGGGGAGAAQIVDVVTFTDEPVDVDTLIAQSNPVAVAAGQKVLVSANVSLGNNTGVDSSTQYLITVESGPSAPEEGPALVTPTILNGDDFPLVAEAAFLGLTPGTYTFGIRFRAGLPDKWVIGDYEIITQVIP